MEYERARIVERFVSVAGTWTRVLSADGEGPTILLLHGFSDSADSFRPVLAELAARSRRAVAVDLPGAGYAAPMGRPPLSSLDEFIEEFVKKFAGDEGVVIAGNSLGGLLALRAARGPAPRWWLPRGWDPPAWHTIGASKPSCAGRPGWIRCWD